MEEQILNEAIERCLDGSAAPGDLFYELILAQLILA
jgi:hypothetical protein